MLSSKIRNKRPQRCYRWAKLFRSTLKNNLRTYDIIQKMATDQGVDYTTACLLDYSYFKEHFKLITNRFK